MKIWVWGYSALMKKRFAQKPRRRGAPKKRAPKIAGPSPMPKEGYPMRVNKYLAHQGVATRRGADELVAKGHVLINGKVANVGDKVDEDDVVELTQKRTPRTLHYYAYDKPRGVITHSPREGEEDILMNVTLPKGVSGLFPVGRLDKDSHGLIILTNDGRVTDRLLNPDRDHEKEYRVKVEKPLRPAFKRSMEGGVNIEGYETAPCKVHVTGPKSFTITLSEGKKHQIRRMVAAHHNVVTDLERVRIMNVRVDGMKAGELRPIQGEELAGFLSSLGLA